jgi:hypothetical protein
MYNNNIISKKVDCASKSSMVNIAGGDAIKCDTCEDSNGTPMICKPDNQDKTAMWMCKFTPGSVQLEKLMSDLQKADKLVESSLFVLNKKKEINSAQLVLLKDLETTVSDKEDEVQKEKDVPGVALFGGVTASMVDTVAVATLESTIASVKSKIQLVDIAEKISKEDMNKAQLDYNNAVILREAAKTAYNDASAKFEVMDKDEFVKALEAQAQQAGNKSVDLKDKLESVNLNIKNYTKDIEDQKDSIAFIESTRYLPGVQFQGVSQKTYDDLNVDVMALDTLKKTKLAVVNRIKANDVAAAESAAAIRTLTKKKIIKKKGVLPIVLGVVGGLLVALVIAYMLMKRYKTKM